MATPQELIDLAQDDLAQADKLAAGPTLDPTGLANLQYRMLSSLARSSLAIAELTHQQAHKIDIPASMPADHWVREEPAYAGMGGAFPGVEMPQPLDKTARSDPDWAVGVLRDLLDNAEVDPRVRLEQLRVVLSGERFTVL